MAKITRPKPPKASAASPIKGPVKPRTVSATPQGASVPLPADLLTKSDFDAALANLGIPSFANTTPISQLAPAGTAPINPSTETDTFPKLDNKTILLVAGGGVAVLAGLFLLVKR